MSGAPHDVFISYSSKDKTTADAVCAVMEQRGIRCWMAPRDVLPGAEWAESIIRAINGARVFVLIFSSFANASLQIKREVERAANRGIPIIPFRISEDAPNETLEFFISTPHWLDAFTPPLQAHAARLAETVQSLLVQLPDGGFHPAPGGQPGRKVVEELATANASTPDHATARTPPAAIESFIRDASPWSAMAVGLLGTLFFIIATHLGRSVNAIPLSVSIIAYVAPLTYILYALRTIPVKGLVFWSVSVVIIHLVLTFIQSVFYLDIDQNYIGVFYTLSFLVSFLGFFGGGVISLVVLIRIRGAPDRHQGYVIALLYSVLLGLLGGLTVAFLPSNPSPLRVALQVYAPWQTLFCLAVLAIAGGSVTPFRREGRSSDASGAGKIHGAVPADPSHGGRVLAVLAAAICLSLIFSGLRGAGLAAAGQVIVGEEQFSGETDAQTLLAAAQAGNARAMFLLGTRYRSGQGVAKDAVGAARWFLASAEGGDVDGMYNLALSYHRGEGVTKDDAEAVRWYSAAAEKGDAGAMSQLGFHYANGEGVAASDAEAVRWFQMAADKGDLDGMVGLGFHYVTGAGVTRDPVKAMSWFRMAAERGDATAMYGLGAGYANGDGLSQDEDEAVRWFRKAARLGNESAVEALERRGLKP